VGLPRLKQVLAAIVLAATAALTGCATDPTTGDRFLSFYSWDDMTTMGLQAAPSFTEQFGGEVPDESIRSYVTEVGMSMVPYVEEGVPDDLPWQFTILNSDVLNAFALPGGQVFITRGLASQLSNEAELAGVLGHEIGHVTARHGNRQVSNATALQIGVTAGAMVVGAADQDSVIRRYGQYGLPVAQIGGQLVILRYGRNAEYQADELGMRYMSRAGYKPSGQRGVMMTLARLSEGAERPPVWLSTHPFPDDRVARIDNLLNTTFREAEADPAHVTRPEVYARRMLRPLQALPPAPPPPTSDETAMLLDSVLWCGICRGDEEPMTLADRWSRRMHAR
jgi:predicted Zn-dependent protease